MAAAAVLATVLVAGLASGSDSGAASSEAVPSTDLGASDESTSSSTAGSTDAEVAAVTDPTVPKSQLTSTLRLGSAGAQVSALQQRLTDLGFGPGPVDGQFGSGTQQAVWAFEKLVLKTPRTKVTGKVTNEIWQALQDDQTVSPRRPTGTGSTHVEVYVPEQVMIVFTNDRPTLISHVSTGEQNADGTPYHWCDTPTYDTDYDGNPLPEPVTRYECADAKTPGGVFRIQRMT
ncbi:MAG: peptidoglycan-binding domain-containing protein, partial [Ilumatobacteraceae bacterium]